jgi:lincosamide nucleotidyltransferase A/C/D/E
MTADDVLEIVGWLRASDVDVWLLGGWGVDALVGEQTRDHKDLDLIVRDDDVARASDVLNERGFRMERGAEGGVILRDGRDRVVDLHSVRFDDRGNGRFENENRGPFEHPAVAFAAGGNIAGRRMACLSAEAQMTNHTWGYTPGDTDFHDMRLLHDRLGTPLLPPFSHRSGA